MNQAGWVYVALTIVSVGLAASSLRRTVKDQKMDDAVFTIIWTVLASRSYTYAWNLLIGNGVLLK